MQISVVIPAYNEEKRIGSCLKSILNQAVKPSEIIVVDNNSTDKTAQIAKEMGATVIQEKKQGLTYARNAGFSHAHGDVIARTDADTIVPATWLERIKKHFEENPKLAALSGPATFGIGVLTPIHKLLIFETNKKIFGHNFLFGPNMAIKRDVWEEVKNEVCTDDTVVHEDFDLSIHIGKRGAISFDPHMKVRTSARRMRSNPSSIFVDYLVRWVDMVASHKQYRISRLTSNIRQKISD